MDIERFNSICEWFNRVNNTPDLVTIPVNSTTITNIKNDLTRLSESIAKEHPFLSAELFDHKDLLFSGYGTINPFVFGQVFEVFRVLKRDLSSNGNDCWALIHPKISKVSKQLYLNGHYSNAACDAFIEINDRVKKLFQKLRPSEPVPDGDGAMKAVFSANSPIIEFCDRSTQTGQNIQKGYMEMLAGAMSALRNPKSHANIPITAEDAMRRLMFASMLMYKIEEAVAYSKITE